MLQLSVANSVIVTLIVVIELHAGDGDGRIKQSQVTGFVDSHVIVAPAIDEVVVTPGVLNVGMGQQTTVRYRLADAASVSVQIWGPNGELVRRLESAGVAHAGNHSMAWDGKDSQGKVVPDEAYTVAIELEEFDEKGGSPVRTVARDEPRGGLGGELMNPQEFHFKPQDNLIEYVLPKPARVRIRAGVDDGPMHITIVNWEPRVAGLVTEKWAGKDQQGVRHFSTRPDCFLTSMAYALPENSVITYGNKDATYAEWYEKFGNTLPHRPRPERNPDSPGVMCPHWSFPPHLTADPEIVVSFPELDGYKESALKRASDGVVQPAFVGGDAVLVRVSIPNEAHLKFLLERQFEVVVFVDDRRFFEAEQSAAPFNFRWDVSMLSSGLHYLTINVVSAADHVGTFTVPVEIKRKKSADVTGQQPTSQPSTP